MKNSTFSDKFEKVVPDRFYQNFIAEQVMIGAAMGLAARGADSVSVDVRLLPRRARPISSAWPRSATSASRWPARTRACRSARTARRRWRSRIWRCAGRSRTSPCCIRATRSAPSGSSRWRGLPSRARSTSARAGRKTPVIYAERRDVLDRRPEGAARERAKTSATVVSAGVTVFEALKAYDQLKARGHRRSASSISIRSRRSTGRRSSRPGRATGGHLITVEDHYAAGGITATPSPKRCADAGLTVRRLAVREIPRSGKPEELLDRFGISAKHIVEAVRMLTKSEMRESEVGKHARSFQTSG